MFYEHRSWFHFPKLLSVITNHSLSSNSRAGSLILLHNIFLGTIFTGEGGVELSVDDPDEKVVNAVPALTALACSIVAVEFDCMFVFESDVWYPRSANFLRWCFIFNVCFLVIYCDFLLFRFNVFPCIQS